jgi:hypothetical protein
VISTKRLLTATACALALGGAVTDQADATPTYIGCASGSATGVAARVAPHTCSTVYPWLDHAHSAGQLVHLHWRHWGSRHATATGIMKYKVYDHTPVRVVASARRCAWEHCAYSRLSTRTPYGHGAILLPFPGDLWPRL